MPEREIDIVIRAKDEFSEPLKKAQASAETAVEKIRKSLESLSSVKIDEAFSSAAGNYATAVKKAAAELKARMDDGGSIPDGAPASNKEELATNKDTDERKRARYQASLEEEVRFRSAKENVEQAYAQRSEEMDRLTWDAKLKYAQFAAGTMSNTLQNLFTVTDGKNRAMFEAMKGFAIAETVIQTYRAAQGAYAALAPIPIVGPALGAAAAAAAIAAGLARVNQIKQTKPGGATGTIGFEGRANPPYSGGSPNAYPVPERLSEDSMPRQNITIQIYNPLAEQNWQRIVEENIIPALKDAGERNVSVTVRNMGSAY